MKWKTLHKLKFLELLKERTNDQYILFRGGLKAELTFKPCWYFLEKKEICMKIKEITQI